MKTDLNLLQLLGLQLLLPLAVLQGADPFADPFAEHVRTTPWLSPQEAQKTFHLPPGFEIQLVAAEPDILKPMNLAFDDRGRLWVTVTREYPYPVLPPENPGRDAIVILEDNDNDGRADKITRYAEGLNIPIGVYPYAGEAVAWSIPNLWRFRDTNGDDRADERERLYGPLGFERDTHGMNSSFQRGFDGWLYITHGYNNNSTVRGSDGSSITMNSGNTYRVRLDGSRVEQHTWGQVNPFGMCLDSLGNLFSADCHSAPVYQLLRGGYYPSFGKPHDGLGFAPVTVTHSHGSTAIAGIACYADTLFPPEFHGNLFIGNVMTSRVNRDALSEHGSTLLGKDLPDFVRTDDPWFRPVSVVLGPDGALYFADFYNRVIGHYEVPLNHPGRDRTSGRIWRVVYRGPDRQQNARPRRDLTRMSLAEVIAALGDDNLTFRLLAMNRLVDHHKTSAVEPLRGALKTASAFQLAHGLWVLARLGAVPPDLLGQAAQHPDRLVRTHVQRILAERADWSADERNLAMRGLRDPDGFVQRCAAEALGLHPAPENVPSLLALRHRLSSEDTHTIYAVRKAIRDQLLEPARFERFRRTELSAADAAVIADVALAIPSEQAASFLLGYLPAARGSRERTAESLRHVARYLSTDDLDNLARFTREHFAGDLDFQSALFQSIQAGLEQRGAGVTPDLKEWGLVLAQALFESTAQASLRWVNTPIDGAPDARNPWSVQTRPSADGQARAPFLSSLPSGEQLTGTLHSETFVIPGQIKFFVAGHDGFPDKPARKLNVIRLRAADSGAVLTETYPPRNDLAQAVTWDLRSHAGAKGYIEITDGDTANAYAWLAVGRFEPPVVSVPELDPKIVRDRQLTAAKLAQRFEATQFQDTLATLLQDAGADPEVRAAAGDTLLSLSPTRALPLIESILLDGSSVRALCEGLGQALGAHSSPAARELLLAVLPRAPYRLQVRYAEALASHRPGAEELLRAAKEGAVPARVFLERSVRDRLLAAKPADAEPRLAALTEGLDPLDEKLQKLIDERRRAYRSHPDVPAGRALFVLHCGACHQVAGEGGLIGPQLDGIGNRGAERLFEDILDPNRNVDKAFRNTLLILKDGDVVSGLFRRQEGEQLVLAEATGKEIFVPDAQVAERRESDTSLMPSNFNELLTPEQFDQLMTFLLAQRQ